MKETVLEKMGPETGDSGRFPAPCSQNKEVTRTELCCEVNDLMGDMGKGIRNQLYSQLHNMYEST